MIGGQVIVPIRGANNQKVKISSTPVILKARTYERIIRAFTLQKELVFNDIIATSGTNEYALCSCSNLACVSVDTNKSIRLTLTGYNDAGVPVTIAIRITNANTAISTVTTQS